MQWNCPRNQTSHSENIARKNFPLFSSHCGARPRRDAFCRSNLLSISSRTFGVYFTTSLTLPVREFGDEQEVSIGQFVTWEQKRDHFVKRAILRTDPERFWASLQQFHVMLFQHSDRSLITIDLRVLDYRPWIRMSMRDVFLKFGKICGIILAT